MKCIFCGGDLAAEGYCDQCQRAGCDSWDSFCLLTGPIDATNRDEVFGFLVSVANVNNQAEILDFVESTTADPLVRNRWRNRLRTSVNGTRVFSPHAGDSDQDACDFAPRSQSRVRITGQTQSPPTKPPPKLQVTIVPPGQPIESMFEIPFAEDTPTSPRAVLGNPTPPTPSMSDRLGPAPIAPADESRMAPPRAERPRPVPPEPKKTMFEQFRDSMTSPSQSEQSRQAATCLVIVIIIVSILVMFFAVVGSIIEAAVRVRPIDQPAVQPVTVVQVASQRQMSPQIDKLMRFE